MKKDNSPNGRGKQEESYTEIVQESIDDLNAAHDFSGTKIQKKPVVRRELPQYNLLKSYPVIFLILLTLLNAVLFAYYAATEAPALSPQAAEQRMKADLGKHAAALKPVRDFMFSYDSFVNRDVDSFTSAVDDFRFQLKEQNIDLSLLPQAEDFQYHGKGLYWSSDAKRGAEGKS